MPNFKNFLAMGFIGAILSSNNPAYSKEKDYVGNLESFFSPKPTQQKETEKEFVDHPEFYVGEGELKEKEQRAAGSNLLGILKSECSRVDFYLMNRGRNKHMIIRCYHGGPGNYRADWGVDIDNVCKAYTRRKRHILFRNENFLIVELSYLEVNSKKMSYESAKEIVKILKEYLEKHNQNQCEDWNRFMQKHYGLMPDVKEE